MFIVIFKTVGYLGWLTTTALGIGGSWFWKFTEDDPDDTDRRKLTPAGRKAIYVMVISVLCAVISTTYTEVDSFRTSQKREAEKRKERESFSQLREKLDDVQTQNSKLQGQNAELTVTVRQLLMRHGLWQYAAGDRSLKSLLDSFDPHIRGRERERNRLSDLLGEPLPFGSVAILATFNLRDTSHGDPVPDRLQKVAAIISLMEADIVWLQEISKQVQLQTLRRLLPQYELRWANVGSAQGAPGTGLAMLYRKATVEILGEPELFPSVPRTASDTAFRWYRVPFSQTVRVGTLKCQLVNVRLYWGASSGERLQRRVEELKELVRWIERRKSEDPLIIAGCFNWPLDDPHMKTLQKPRLFFPSTKLPADATESCHGEIIKRYSHFALSTSIESCYIEGSVRYQELTPLYPDWSASEWSNFADLNPLLIALRVD